MKNSTLTVHENADRERNVNMQRDYPARHELEVITNENLEETYSDDTVENVLGSVHISKPSIQRVFFLLKPILNPVLKQINKLQTDLDALVNEMKLERVMLDKPVQISQNVGYTVDYRARKFLYLWNPTGFSMVVNGQLLPADAGKWTPIMFTTGTIIYANGISDATPVSVVIRACDMPLATYANLLSGSTVGLAAGSSVALTADYPNGAIPITASSGNQANANAVATLAGIAGKTTYITGFDITGEGATAGLAVLPTITGVVSGTLTYNYKFVAGASAPNAPLQVTFGKPIPASAQNTPIVVTCPAGGAGNTNNTVNAYGYQL